MKKRIVTLLLAGAMTAAFITGCGNQGNTAGGAQNNAAGTAQTGTAGNSTGAQQNPADSQAGGNAQSGNGAQQGSSDQQGAAQNGTASGITADQARSIALDRAGVSEADTIAIAVNQEWDDGISVYNVDIYTPNQDYDFEIGAADGTVYGQESEPAERITSTAVQTGFSLDQAKKALLAKVPGASEDNLRISLDRDDGRYRYEGEIIYDNKSYEYEMDAETGDIYEWSEELLSR